MAQMVYEQRTRRRRKSRKKSAPLKTAHSILILFLVLYLVSLAILCLDVPELRSSPDDLLFSRILREKGNAPMVKPVKTVATHDDLLSSRIQNDKGSAMMQKPEKIIDAPNDLPSSRIDLTSKPENNNGILNELSSSSPLNDKGDELLSKPAKTVDVGIDGHEEDEKKHKDVETFSRSDFELRDFPDHCYDRHSSVNGKNWNEIIIKGERHCGTNWVRSILQANVEEKIAVNQTTLDIGWKHGFLPPEGWGKPIAENEMLLVVTRDVFTWLPKMRIKSYDPGTDAGSEYKRNFTDFLQKFEYTARCQPFPGKRKMVKDLSKYQLKFCSSLLPDEEKEAEIRGLSAEDNIFEHLDLNPRKIIAERAENFIQIRTQKYKQWLSDDPPPEAFEGTKEDFVKNRRIHIPLESLSLVDEGEQEYNDKDDGKGIQERLIGDQLSNHCLPVYKNFHEVVERTKWPGYKTRRWAGRKFNSRKEKKKLLKNYSKADLRYVLSQLDLEFEKKLGYTYDYVYELLENDDVPEQQPEQQPQKRGSHRFHINGAVI